MGGRTLAVASGKGGVGKTSTVANLGAMLWSIGDSVAVVDGDLGMANLAIPLGVDPDVTLHDVLAGEATVEEAIVTEGGFSLLPGGTNLREFAIADPSNLDDVIGALSETHDYVFVDTGAGLNYETVLPLGMVGEVLLVTTPEEIAVDNVRRVAEFTEKIDGTIRGVIVNRASGDVDAEAIAAELGTELLAVIPDDDTVTESMEAGTPLWAYAPDSDAADAYRQLAAIFS